MEYVQEPEADEHGKNDPDPEDESGFTFLQVDFEEIKAQNPDVAAWIQIPALWEYCVYKEVNTREDLHGKRRCENDAR